MSDFLAPLKNASRVLIELISNRLPALAFNRPDFLISVPRPTTPLTAMAASLPLSLVESAQSMANRLEAVCWDEPTDDVVSELKGFPFVRVKLTGIGAGTDTTCSLLEFHRLNSPYIMSGVTSDGTAFADLLKPQLGLAMAPTRKASTKKSTEAASGKSVEASPAPEDAATDKERDDVAGVVNLHKLAAVCFKYDPNSLVHGVFLEKIAGRLRHPRALSAFIEASGVGRADSGGVKFDRALPKPKVAGVDAKGGYGNVPFHRTEFTAKTITAFFSLDLAQTRGYGLPGPRPPEHAGWCCLCGRCRRFLDSNMRLRTACELELAEGEKSIRVKRLEAFTLPSSTVLAQQLADLIVRCKVTLRQPGCDRPHLEQLKRLTSHARHHQVEAFPAGRYHATPWGRHVNEGIQVAAVAVAFAPGPWSPPGKGKIRGFERSIRPSGSGWQLVQPPLFHLPSSRVRPTPGTTCR